MEENKIDNLSSVSKDSKRQSSDKRSFVTTKESSCVVRGANHLLIECKKFNKPRKTILLPTTTVRFHCGKISGTARILLDSCSQPTLISDKFVRGYRLPTSQSINSSSVTGVGGNVSSNRTCLLQLMSSYKPLFSISIEDDVVPSTAMNYNVQSLQVDSLQIKHLKLADSALYKSVVNIAHIDLILVAEHFEACMLADHKTINGTFLRETVFGWTITGPVSVPESNQNHTSV